MLLTYHLKFSLNIHQFVYDIDEDHHYLMHIISKPKKKQIYQRKKYHGSFTLVLQSRMTLTITQHSDGNK